VPYDRDDVEALLLELSDRAMSSPVSTIHNRASSAVNPAFFQAFAFSRLSPVAFRQSCASPLLYPAAFQVIATGNGMAAASHASASG